MKKVKLTEICSPKQWKIIQKNKMSDNGKYPVYGANGIIGHYDEFNHENETILIACRGTCGKVHFSLPFSYITGNAMCLDNLNENLCDKKYLYYYLKHYNMQKITTGTSQPQITIQSLEKVYIKLYSKNEQIKIANKLDTTQKIIDIRKKQIEELDRLIKSEFINMFGNVKENDKKWRYTTLGNECILNPNKSEIQNLPDDTELSFVAMQSVSEKGDIDTDVIKKYGNVKKGFTYFKENDVLFAKITPCMENGKGAVAKGLKNGLGFGSTEFHVLRPKEKINSTWLYTLTSIKDFRIEAEKKMTGSAGQKRVPISFLANYKLGIPPIELQNKFANIVKDIKGQKSKVEKSLFEMEKLQESLMDKYFD